MYASWFNTISKATINADSIGRISTVMADHNLELGLRLFDSCVHLINHNRIPYRCNILERARILQRNDVIRKLEVKDADIYKNNTVFDTLLNNELNPEKFKSVSSKQYDGILNTLSNRKLNHEVLGWFNYYAEPTNFAYSKVMANLFKLNPKMCLELYLKRRQELLPESDIYLDNIGLKCYLAFQQNDKAMALYNSIEKDDCSYAYMLDHYSNSEDAKCSEIYQDFKNSGSSMNMGSAKIFAKYLISNGKSEALFELLHASKLAYESKFGIILSVSILQSILSSDAPKTLTQQLIEEFDGMTYPEVRSVLEYYGDRNNMVFTSNSNVKVMVTNLLKDASMPSVYVDHKSHEKWVLFSKLCKEFTKKRNQDSVSLHLLLTFIHHKVLVSQKVDAEMLSYKILGKELPERLDSIINSDPLLRYIYNLPYSTLISFNALVRTFSKIAIHNPNLSHIYEVMSIFQADGRLQIWIITTWFKMHPKSDNDYLIIRNIIINILNSERSELWPRHFSKLYEMYMSKRKLHPKDKEIYKLLLMNFSNIRVVDLQALMKRFASFDLKYSIEMYQLFSPIMFGTQSELNEIDRLYWSLLTKSQLEQELLKKLEILKHERVDDATRSIVLKDLEYVADFPLKRKFVEYLKDSDNDTARNGRTISNSNLRFLKSLRTGLKMAHDVSK